MTVTEESVVLVSPAGEPIGQRLKSEVHDAETPLHLAFSLYLFDADDRLLLTRRALGKRTWPGVWTNTCCGHPAPGEAVEDAVRRRVGEELGLVLGDLECVLPDFAYTATDASGVVENEICPVYRARTLHPATDPLPNPAEVMDWKWGAWDDVVRAAEATPFVFSPWSVLQVERLAVAG
ncbi:isopentenyl-diphosphate delta-isomerase [Friedmanniella luteola]|uniref:Isopentenyl-diphosphate Delta-isomerase n=1 Tax=Friedmanniella luteola TaxID=546871 RepID=A0A1H1LLR5_9ACTN|nr:isopentenyl-diphosphate Delta-isomerase [Friedmanniella luteola]SDR75466.1 isopentenyl-diphosphate delta-isomerase [Friedmanniella luteola]